MRTICRRLHRGDALELEIRKLAGEREIQAGVSAVIGCGMPLG